MQPRPALIDLLPEAVVVVDSEGTVRWANARAEQRLGRPRSEWVGGSGLDLIHPDDHQFALLSLGSVQSKDIGSPIELRLATAEGWRLTEIVGAPLDEGYIALSMRDVTDRRRWEVASDDSRLRAVIQNSPALTILVDEDGIILSASAALTRLLGHDPEFVCGQPLDQIVRKDDREAIGVALHNARQSSGGDAARVEVELITGDGTVVPYELALVSLLDDPTVEGIIVAGHDISQLRAAQIALAEQANFDALTGLVNRRAFEADLEREWSLTNRDGVDSVLIVADLDGFKELNDRAGHAAGDEALRDFGRCLRLAVRETDVVARLGGDEFGVILVRCGGEMAAVGFEAELEEIMSDRLDACADYGLSVSVGYASLRRSPTPAAAFEQADAAMFAAKRARQAARAKPLTWIGSKRSGAPD